MEPEDDDDKDREEWLELGLGLSTARSIAGPEPGRVPPGRALGEEEEEEEEEEGGGLGLGLGIGNGDDGVRKSGEDIFGHGHHHRHHHQHLLFHVDGASSASLTSLLPSSSSWRMDPNRSTLLDLNPVQQTGLRHRTGLWFCLRASASRNGGGEALQLPQIPKAYIRVKDENVTVFMVKTYLVRKLGLTTEAEIDISCMGQKLLQSQTLKHVRDTVWLPRVMESLKAMRINDEHRHMAVDHFMSLHYERGCFFH